MASKFFWPAMNQEVASWAKACISCQRSKVNRHVVTPLAEFPPSQRFEHIHIDIVGPLRLSQDYRYCVTMIDRCTKWPEAVPLKEITAESLAKALYENWITKFGTPLRLTSDQGMQFQSSLFNTLMKKFGVARIRTTAYHPQANGQVERLHRTMKAALMARGATTTWADELPTVLLGLRTAIRDDNNLSPALMTYGATLRIPSDFLVPTESKIEDADFVRRLSETMASLTPKKRSPSTRSTFIYKDLATCTHVFVRNDTVRAPLTPPYDGPYQVLKRHDKYYQIQLPLRSTVVSIERLKPAYILNDDDTATSTTSTTNMNAPAYVKRSGRVVKKVVRFA